MHPELLFLYITRAFYICLLYFIMPLVCIPCCTNYLLFGTELSNVIITCAQSHCLNAIKYV